MKVALVALLLFVGGYFATLSARKVLSGGQESVPIKREMLVAMFNSKESPRLLKQLLDKGTDPNSSVPYPIELPPLGVDEVRASKTIPLLQYALMEESTETVRELLDRGADWKGLKYDQAFYLQKAARSYLPLVKMMVEGGWNPYTIVDGERSSLLHELVRYKVRFSDIDTDALEGPNKDDQDFRKSIEDQLKKRWLEYEECASWLIGKGANVNEPDIYGDTPLHLAARNRDGAGLVAMLIRKGADLNLVNKDGCTPLDAAVLALNKDAVALLRKAGAKMTPRKSADQVGDIAGLLKSGRVNDAK